MREGNGGIPGLSSGSVAAVHLHPWALMSRVCQVSSFCADADGHTLADLESGAEFGSQTARPAQHGNGLTRHAHRILSARSAPADPSVRQIDTYRSGGLRRTRSVRRYTDRLIRARVAAAMAPAHQYQPPSVT